MAGDRPVRVARVRVGLRVVGVAFLPAARLAVAVETEKDAHEDDEPEADTDPHYRPRGELLRHNLNWRGGGGGEEDNCGNEWNQGIIYE